MPWTVLGNLSNRQIDRFKQIVKNVNEKFGVKVEIQARPINEYAAKVKGGIGKVEAVPTKNLTPDDVILGAPPEWVGQAGYYPPKLPKNFNKLDAAEKARLQLRFDEKSKEFKQFIEPRTMRLSAVEVDNLHAADLILDFYMGKNTPARREYIMGHLVVEVEAA